MLLAKPALSQKVKVEAILDTNVMLVGDQINFRLGLTIPKDYNFEWPNLNDTLTSNIEIVRKYPIDTITLDNDLMTIGQDFTITAFDSGYYVIPPINLSYGAAGASPDRQIETEPHLLNVFTVAVDTTQTFRPIKGPIDAPYTFAEIFPWILLAIAILLIAGFTIYFLVRKEKNIPLFATKPRPKLPPHKVALDALYKLQEEKIWQQGDFKEFHSRLTDITRVYIEDSMDVRAVEMTTPEIMDSIKQTDISKKDIEILGEILELADLVKFAKFKPQPTENEQSMDWSFTFVKHTMKNQEPAEVKKPENKNEIELIEVKN